MKASAERVTLTERSDWLLTSTATGKSLPDWFSTSVWCCWLFYWPRCCRASACVDWRRFMSVRLSGEPLSNEVRVLIYIYAGFVHRYTSHTLRESEQWGEGVSQGQMTHLFNQINSDTLTHIEIEWWTTYWQMMLKCKLVEAFWAQNQVHPHTHIYKHPEKIIHTDTHNKTLHYSATRWRFSILSQQWNKEIKDLSLTHTYSHTHTQSSPSHSMLAEMKTHQA